MMFKNSVSLVFCATWSACCSVGGTRGGDEASGSIRQRPLLSAAGEQEAERRSAGSPADAARSAPTAAGGPAGQEQDGGAFTAQKASRHIAHHSLILGTC